MVELSTTKVVLISLFITYCLLAIYRLYVANLILYFHNGDKNDEFTTNVWDPLRWYSYISLWVRTNDFDVRKEVNADLAQKLGLTNFPTIVKVTHYGVVEELPADVQTESDLLEWAKKDLESAEACGVHIRNVH
jgi:hypothetical protein